jgi:hypothetical protein
MLGIEGVPGHLRPLLGQDPAEVEYFQVGKGGLRHFSHGVGMLRYLRLQGLKGKESTEDD